MKHLLLTFTLLLSLTACQDKKNDNHATIKPKKEAKHIEEKKKEDTKPSQTGIVVKDSTIIIDTNKTKDFLHNFSQNIKNQMQKISTDLQKGILETKEAGININSEHINIDLNKTKNLLESWNNKIQVFAKEFDNIDNTSEMNKSKKK